MALSDNEWLADPADPERNDGLPQRLRSLRPFAFFAFALSRFGGTRTRQR